MRRLMRTVLGKRSVKARRRNGLLSDCGRSISHRDLTGAAIRLEAASNDEASAPTPLAGLGLKMAVDACRLSTQSEEKQDRKKPDKGRRSAEHC